MANQSPHFTRAVRVTCAVAGLAVPVSSAVAAWTPVPGLTNSPAKSQFATYELYFSDSDYEMPYYLKHFAQVANAVVETGFNRVETNGTSSTTVTNFYPPGFLDMRVNREPRDNRPYNARIMEMQMALAYFYGADRPWNPYRGHPAVRARLEAMLDRWTRIQNPDGLFAEYSPNNYSLAPTNFGAMAAAQTVEILRETKAPFDEALLRRVEDALRAALFAMFTREDMRRHARDWSNQFSGSYYAALVSLRHTPDARRRALSRLRLSAR